MRAIVIGAGPSGLACAACLQRQGIDTLILERSEAVGASWRGHYRGLSLHTARARSGLPYMAMPRRYGRFPTRDDMIEYLEDYARAFDLSPRFGTRVTAVVPEAAGWRVCHDGGAERADAVILATGLNGAPSRPDLPGLAGFPGPVLHSSEYADARPFAGQRVLVVGLGNSGGDIALELADMARPTLSVRGPVNILPYQLFGIPITSLGGLRKVMPYRWADALTAPLLRARIGRPQDYGLQPAGKGPAAQVIEDGRVPLIDHGTLAAIRAGRIAVRPAISGVEGQTVRFADGRAEDFDAILLATGYRVDLRALLPRTPQALDEDGRPRRSGAPGPMPGLYFCSYTASADGQLRQSGIEARAIAEHLAQRMHGG